MLINGAKILQFALSKEKETKIFIVIFYTVGIIGLSLTLTHALFLELIPVALALSFIALAIFHPSKKNKKTTIVFSGIFILSIVIEAIGVNTGLIFGNYLYGNSLGFKVFNTPIIIGINWLFLVYTSSSVLEQLKIHVYAKIVFSSLIMLVYDIVLEQVASKIDMWYWSNNIIPFQNYIAWFFISLFFHSIIKGMQIKTHNKLALIILISQFVFFLSLYIL